MADGNPKAIRKLEGQKTMLGRTMHGIAYDPVNDEFIVPQPFAQAVLVFRGDANGEVAPVRYIQGPKTMLSNPDKLEVDPVHNEIFVPDDQGILVFSRTANGNVAPLRVMKPPADVGIDAVAVDPVHDVVIATNPRGTPREKYPRVLILDRSGDGEVEIKGVIGGPKTMITGTFGVRAIPQSGLFLLAMNGPVWSGPVDEAFVGVWSIHDNGEVPPRWTIGGPYQALKQPRGMDLDFKNKNVIISDKVLNAILTYHFPEIF